jgi:hypothetical protein
MADFRTDTSAIKVDPVKGVSLADMLNIQKSTYELNKLKELYPSIISEQQAKSKQAGISANVEEQTAEPKIQKAQSEARVKQLDAQKAHTQYIIQNIQDELRNPNISVESLTKKAIEINQRIPGGPDPKALEMALSGIPKTKNPTELRAYLATGLAKTLDSQVQLEKMYPAPAMQNLNNVVVPVQQGNSLLTGQQPGQQVGVASQLGLPPTTTTPTPEGGSNYVSGNVPATLPPAQTTAITNATDALKTAQTEKTNTSREVANLSKIEHLIDEPDIQTGPLADYFAGKTNMANLNAHTQELVKGLEAQLGVTNKTNEQMASARTQLGSIGVKKEALRKLIKTNSANVILEDLKNQGIIKNSENPDKPNTGKINKFVNEFQTNRDTNVLRYLRAKDNDDKAEIDYFTNPDNGYFKSLSKSDRENFLLKYRKLKEYMQ